MSDVYFTDRYKESELQKNLNALIEQGYEIKNIFYLGNDQMDGYQHTFFVIALRLKGKP
jgi:hypothetical protein